MASRQLTVPVDEGYISLDIPHGESFHKQLLSVSKNVIYKPTDWVIIFPLFHTFIDSLQDKLWDLDMFVLQKLRFSVKRWYRNIALMDIICYQHCTNFKFISSSLLSKKPHLQA